MRTIHLFALGYWVLCLPDIQGWIVQKDAILHSIPYYTPPKSSTELPASVIFKLLKFPIESGRASLNLILRKILLLLGEENTLHCMSLAH